MKLMFLATRTRPDILSSACGLSTKCKSPNEADMKRLKRIIGYLAYTQDLKLKCKVTELTLNGYFDASHAVYPDMKGLDGMIIAFGHIGFPIVCKSLKQKAIARSSTESEQMCLFKGVDLLLYKRRLCIFLGILTMEDVVDVY